MSINHLYISRRVNWIYATTTFALWKNTITKTELGNMPLQLSYTSIHAIFFNQKHDGSNNTYIERI
jgi:hypothetical protein